MITFSNNFDDEPQVPSRMLVLFAQLAQRMTEQRSVQNLVSAVDDACTSIYGEHELAFLLAQEASHSHRCLHVDKLGTVSTSVVDTNALDPYVAGKSNKNNNSHIKKYEPDCRWGKNLFGDRFTQRIARVSLPTVESATHYLLIGLSNDCAIEAEESIVTTIAILLSTALSHRLLEKALQESLLSADQLKRETECALIDLRDQENKLAEVSTQQRYVLDSIDYGVIFLDSKLNVQLVNQKGMDIGRFTDDFIATRPSVAEAFVFTRDQNGYHGINSDNWSKYQNRRVRQIAQPVEHTEELQHKDGRIYNHHIKPLPDGGRMLTYYDITQLRRTQEALERTQYVVDNAPLSIFWLQNDKIIYVNKSACRMLGYTQTELLQKTINDIDPHGAAEVLILAERLKRDIDTVDQHFDSNYKTKENQFLPVELRLSLLTFGDHDYLTVFVSDISERKTQEDKLKQSQKRYQALYLGADRSRRELKLIDKIQTLIANKLNNADLYAMVVNSVQDIFKFERTTISVVRNERVWYEASAGTAIGEDHDGIEVKDSVPGRCMQTGKPLLFEHPNCPKDLHYAQAGINSCLYLPIKGKDLIHCVLGVESSAQQIRRQDQHTLVQVAEQITLALENARLLEVTQNDLVRTKALYAIGNALQNSRDLESLMSTIIYSVRDALSARCVVAYKLDMEADEVLLAVVTESEDMTLEPMDISRIKQGLAGWVVENQESAVTHGDSPDPREDPEFAKALCAYGIGSMLYMPLVHQGKTIGLIAAVNRLEDDDFTQNDKQLLSAVAGQAGVALVRFQLLKQVESQALEDALTGLPNRRLFEDRLDRALKVADRSELRVAILFLDLDGFKNINDSLGHHVGDALLIEVAARLNLRLRSTDTLARMGGDEFALLMVNFVDNDSVEVVAAEYLSLFSNGFQVGEHELFVGASIGISIYPIDGQDASTLLRHADSAMYHAKAQGKNNVQRFDFAIAQRVSDRVSMESDLRGALEEQQFELHYQPQYNLANNQIVGFEALIRWNHPTHNLVPPDQFIPVAEESRLILPIGDWVLRSACSFASQLQSCADSPCKVAVNISALQFEDPGFFESVKDILADTLLPAGLLELELTETVVMNDVNLVIERLEVLRELGVRISIDDFGTGYSSLSYLQKLPLDSIKIDRSFVSAIADGTGRRQSVLVDTIVTMAQRFGFSTIAEGIETEHQRDYLRAIGCDEAQGYFFSRPVPQGDVHALLRPLPDIASAS